METFHLVSKITAKHLYARLKGKSGVTEPVVEKKKAEKSSASRPKIDLKPETPAAEPPKAPEVNPFADSVPFAESSPYERMEEVSLEQLLSEGRERPATFAGNVPIPLPIDAPIDDVEELGAAEMVVEEPPVAVAVEEEPAPSPGPSIEEQLESLRAQHRAELERILDVLDDLTRSIRSRL